MQADCSRGPRSDKEGFALLVRDLSVAFRSRGLLLSAAVSANKIVIDRAYDVPYLVEYLDWISVMAYDYHSAWERETGHVAPLYHCDDGSLYLNVNFSLRYWINKGAPSDKLVMGIPAYGQSFTLSRGSEYQMARLHATVSGPGEPGKFTKSPGFLAYYEVTAVVTTTLH